LRLQFASVQPTEVIHFEMSSRFAPEADSSIDWAAGIEEIRQSPDRQHIDGGHTIASKAEGRGAGS
jgi:hypothetical protein